MEHERQRVLVEALKETCHQTEQPMTVRHPQIEGLIMSPPTDPKELAGAIEGRTELVERMGRSHPPPPAHRPLQWRCYIERLDG